MLFRIYTVSGTHPLPLASLSAFLALLNRNQAQKLAKFSSHLLFLSTGTFSTVSSGLYRARHTFFVQSLHAGYTVEAAACLHTSTFLRFFLSHSAEPGRGRAVNLHSYTPVLPDTHQTGLIWLCTTLGCCVVVNEQRCSAFG